MFNVIEFLERVGQDALLRQNSQGEVALALANEEVDAEFRAAILSKDQPWLEKLLGQGPHCCALFPAEEEESGEDDEGEDSPSREGEASAHHARRAAAQ
ncbi:MAG: hypothetical protein ABI268_05320 [Rhodanobacter sp.]